MAMTKRQIKKKEEHEVKRRRVRKERTHINGKPVLTAKMIRDLNEQTNPLIQLILIITKCFPSLLKDLAELTDTRNESYIEYNIEEVTLIRLLALCCGIKSMAEISKKFNKNEFISNINKILNTDLKNFPSDDTISRVINSLDVNELAKIRTKLVKKLIEAKTLDKFRLSNGSFYVVIDGTGLFSTAKNLGTNCIYKTYNKGTDDEYTLYQYYVLEAKIICGNCVFSLATEFVENQFMNTETEKQDCELKAAYRLLKKIRDAFPKLPITIGADALYVNKPFMDACCSDDYQMDYILRYKETVMSTIEEEFKKIDKIVKGEYEYVNNIGFGSGTKNTEGITNIIHYHPEKEEENKLETGEIDEVIMTKSQDFKFITSLNINEDNYEEIVMFGRRRWKIENQGFKDQKGKVLNITHGYTFDSNGTKAHYYFIQIAHLLLTLLYYGSSIIKKLKTSKVEISFRLLEEFRKIQDMNLDKAIQIRFDVI